MRIPDICTQFGTNMQHGAEYGQKLQNGFQPRMSSRA